LQQPSRQFRFQKKMLDRAGKTGKSHFAQNGCTFSRFER
jgi:hypothetical protein